MADSRYVLMHKNTPVADLQLDTDTGVIRSVGHVYNALHVPVGIPVKKGVIDRSALNTWWTGRAIPASRDRIRDALRELELASTQLLLDKCLGLRLSDQYWICPASSGVRWEEVNFFQNAFSDDVGNILLGRGSSSGRVSLMSPDYPYSVCEDFITPETELIPAWYIMQTVKRPNHVSVYQHYLDCCEALDVPGVREAVDRMIVLDYLIVNEDRHQNNFGVVRNAETLEYLGAAPIYDSGTSLWFDKPTGMVGSGRVTCKPFKDRHEEQIKLVSSFDWLDLSKLDGIEEEWMELTKGSLFLDEARRIAVARALRWRIETLKEISRCGVYAVPGTGHDVTEDIRYSGQSEQ